MCIRDTFLVIGMLMEANAAVVMMTPLLRPLMLSLGLSDIHFCMMMCVNLYIGLMTPPVGVCLLLGNQIAGARLERTLKDALPMLGLGLIVLLLVTYVPVSYTHLDVYKRQGRGREALSAWGSALPRPWRPRCRRRSRPRP